MQSVVMSLKHCINHRNWFIYSYITGGLQSNQKTARKRSWWTAWHGVTLNGPKGSLPDIPRLINIGGIRSSDLLFFRRRSVLIAFASDVFLASGFLSLSIWWSEFSYHLSLRHVPLPSSIILYCQSSSFSYTANLEFHLNLVVIGMIQIYVRDAFDQRLLPKRCLFCSTIGMSLFAVAEDKP